MAKKITRILLIALFFVLGFTNLLSQTTLVNYDFNSASAYPTAPATTVANVTSSANCTEAFTTFGGVATTAGAFTANSTAGNAIAMNNSSGTNTKYFTVSLGGSALANYKTLKLYFQAQRSNTGATLITVQYSLNGGAYTAFTTNTMSPQTSFNATTLVLPAAVDNPTSLDIRLFASGASGSGTLRIDNFQVQGVLAPAAPSLNITNNGLQPNAATILQSSNDNILQRFVVTEGNVAAGTLNSISIPLAGTYATSDINAAGLKLYAGTSNSFASATLLSSKTSASSGSGESVSFNSLNYAIAKNTARYFWVTADVSPSGTVGNTIRATALNAGNFTFAAGTVTASVNQGGIQTIAAPIPSLTISNNGTQPAAALVLQNSSDNLLQSFMIAEGNVASGTLNTVAIPLAGTYSGSDINGAGLKLYASATNNFASATLLSSKSSIAAGSGEMVNFNSLNYAVAKNSTHYFWVTADIANSATVGNTINASALSAGNFTFAAGSVIASVNAGGVQTIDAAPVLTQLRTSYCGYTAQSFGEFIGADSVLGAHHYRFQLVNSATSYTQTFTNSSGYPYLTLYTIPGISYNTTYTVTVAWSADGVTWSNYGSPCTITSPMNEVTELQPAYCGITATSASQIIYANRVSGATQYEYRLMNSATSYTQTFVKTNNNFALSQFTGLQPGTTYSVSVRVFIFGAWDIYGTSCNVTTPSGVTTTSLQPSSCGVTASSYTQVLYAVPVASATQYEYRLMNTALSYTQTFVKTNNNFNLSQFSGLANATSYSVAVRANVGGVWGNFAGNCNVTTPSSIPTTSLQPTSCGITASSYAQVLYAVALTGATQYEYRLENASASYTQTLVKSNNNFNLTQFSGLTNGTTYSVSVRANVSGIWGNFGPVCTVATPASSPTTSLQPASCGITASSYTQLLYAVAVSGATQYEYQLTNAASSYTQSFVKSNNNFNLSQFTGLTNSTAYDVQVRVFFNGGWGNYGSICSVTTPASAILLNGNASLASREGVNNAEANLAGKSFDAIAYPNPFNQEFSVSLVSYTVNEPVHIRVYDATGKLVEQHDLSPESVKDLRIGAAYAEGLYNILLSQGTQQTSIKVIRQ